MTPRDEAAVAETAAERDEAQSALGEIAAAIFGWPEGHRGTYDTERILASVRALATAVRERDEARAALAGEPARIAEDIRAALVTAETGRSGTNDWTRGFDVGMNVARVVATRAALPAPGAAERGWGGTCVRCQCLDCECVALAERAAIEAAVAWAAVDTDAACDPGADSIDTLRCRCRLAAARKGGA